MAEIAAFFRGENGTQLLFYFFRFFAMAQSQSSADSDAMGITNNASGYGVQITKKQIGGFSANAGNPQQFLHSTRDFALIVR